MAEYYSRGTLNDLRQTDAECIAELEAQIAALNGQLNVLQGQAYLDSTALAESERKVAALTAENKDLRHTMAGMETVHLSDWQKNQPETSDLKDKVAALTADLVGLDSMFQRMTDRALLFEDKFTVTRQSRARFVALVRALRVQLTTAHGIEAQAEQERENAERAAAAWKGAACYEHELATGTRLMYYRHDNIIRRESMSRRNKRRAASTEAARRIVNATVTDRGQAQFVYVPEADEVYP